jgi:hypothetical protein
MHRLIGLGSTRYPLDLPNRINFYIANRPPLDNYPALRELRGLASGELAHIVKHTSNHWRKVFNVYAKLLFDWYQLNKRPDLPHSWQVYRDQELFQSHSQEALLFSPPEFNLNAFTTDTFTAADSTADNTSAIHIIAGKTYAARLSLPPLVWLDTHFALNQQYRLIVAPYPDYRQLSNERIAQLIRLMASL